MSRSFKNHIGHYYLCNVHSRIGKMTTSRRIRHAVKNLLKTHDPEKYFDFADIQDSTRGNKGSRCPDYGWDFFGDGYNIFYSPDRFNYVDEEDRWWYYKLGLK